MSPHLQEFSHMRISTLDDVEYLAPRLRFDDKQEILAASGLTPYVALKQSFEKSQICLKNICAFQITFFFLKFISVLFKSRFLLLQICICATQITFSLKICVCAAQIAFCISGRGVQTILIWLQSRLDSHSDCSNTFPFSSLSKCFLLKCYRVFFFTGPPLKS